MSKGAKRSKACLGFVEHIRSLPKQGTRSVMSEFGGYPAIAGIAI